MKTKHTAGNWHAKDGQIYPTETSTTLAIIPYFDNENEEQQANARLIAAAPDLLEACLLAIMDFDHEGGHINPDTIRLLRQATNKVIV